MAVEFQRKNYFSTSSTYQWNTAINAALQRSAMFIENNFISCSTPAECYVSESHTAPPNQRYECHLGIPRSGDVVSSMGYKHIAPLEQRGLPFCPLCSLSDIRGEIISYINPCLKNCPNYSNTLEKQRNSTYL